MKKNNLGFTFVELLVGITISVILMTSVSIFVTSGIGNLTKQKQILENSEEINNKLYLLQDYISNSSKFIGEFGSGFLLKIDKNYDKGGYIYIGTENQNRTYCSTGETDLLDTNHLLVKQFIPFEEIGEDIFANYSKTLTGSFSTYTSFYKEHIIKNSNIIIAGKEIFGNNFISGNTGTGVFLNSPTGLAEGENKLFISDTLNNRILYIDLSVNRIFTLLDEDDGINEPTGLFYSGATLFIANSGNGEILSYGSENLSYTSKTLSINPEADIDDVNHIKIEFFSGSINLSNPNLVSDLSFTNLTQDEDFLETSGNSIDYYYSDYSNPSPSIPNIPCSSNSTTYIKNLGNPQKQTITGCNGSTGTLNTYTGNIYQDLLSGNNYEININNIDTSSFTGNNNYYIKLELYNGLNLVHQNYYNFLTKGDLELSTINDNVLNTITGGLNYPTGISRLGSNIRFNEFETRKTKIINIRGDFINSADMATNFSSINFNLFPLNTLSDFSLDTPIKDIKIDYSNNLLTLQIEYYSLYGCYDENNKNTKTMIIKKHYE